MDKLYRQPDFKNALLSIFGKDPARLSAVRGFFKSFTLKKLKGR